MDFLEELITRYPQLNDIKADIEDAYRLLEDTYTNGGKILIGGNGGSMADSEHIVGELMKSFVKKRNIATNVSEQLKKIDAEHGEKLASLLQGALPAIALTGHNALSTAFLNDVDPTLCYAQQVYGYGKAGDTLIAISTSGNAENLVNAAITAKAMGMKVLLLSGKDGGKLKKYVDLSVIVPEKETYKIQELHLPIYHALCLMLEDKFF